MANELDTKSRNLLSFRPNIHYVEPPQEPVAPNPISIPVVDDGANKVTELNNLAGAVGILAAAVQEQIDTVSANIVIKLDPRVDAAAMSAIGRQFPGADTNYITYPQYKQMRDLIQAYGEEAASDAITPDGTTPVPVFGSAAAADGSLRPELNVKAQVIQPIDMQSFQADLLEMLANMLWKMLIYNPLNPIVSTISFGAASIPENMPGYKTSSATAANAANSSVKSTQAAGQSAPGAT